MTDSRRGALRDPALVALARMAPLLVQLAATPFVIATIGESRYAVWALMMTTINLLLTADLGVVGVMQRYHGVSRGRGDVPYGARVTGGVLLVLLAGLIVITAAGPWISRAVVSVVDLGPQDVGDAALVFRHTGTIAIIQLISLAFSSYLAAHERFVALAGMSLLARTVLAIGLAVALLGGHGLPGLLLASYADAVVASLVGAWLCRSHLRSALRTLPRRDEARELAGYAWRNQASAFAFVAQREADVLIAAAFLPAAALATVAATAPLTAAVALAPTVTLTPLFTTLSVKAGRDPDTAREAAASAQRAWFGIVLPYAAVVLGVLPMAAAAWLGPTIDNVPAVTFLLAAGFLISLLSAVQGILSRAVGRPGLETRSYTVYIAVKVALGIALALAVGPLGLAASGAVAAVVMVAFFAWTMRRTIGLHTAAPARRSVVVSLLLLALTTAGSWAIARTGLERPAELALLAGLGGAAVVLAWFALRPRPALPDASADRSA